MTNLNMPHLFPFASHAPENAIQEMDQDYASRPPRRPSLLKNIGSLLKKNHDRQDLPPQCDSTIRRSSVPDIPSYGRPVPSLPRPQTVQRQDSERRDKLQEVLPSPTEKRAASVDRRRTRGLSTNAQKRQLSPPCIPIPSMSAPNIISTHQIHELQINSNRHPPSDETQMPPRLLPPELPPLQIPDNEHLNDNCWQIDEEEDPEIDRKSLQDEFDQRWVLNLSMHFRDKSNREKFFVTFAESPDRWRRLTVSVDYRNAPIGSLEADLSTLHYQSDKSFRIYESIRESLPEIKYYDTVTNLKLETTQEDGQLHVHVREDANEVISYPSLSLFQHVNCQLFTESQVNFDSHISGFVYKVWVNGNFMVKKEIPGPHTVEEFIYEVNALDSLIGCENVVQLQGLVTDDSGSVVKGLLISYAAKGALVDMIYDYRGTVNLPWHRREKWAKQIVQGLSDIHEAGFVQGDFTLSNIVIDEQDNAQIIDINRRGCPVGWEPPELGRLIENGQRISMCIGVKTDLYQLGMVLWAIAEEVDEPERQERPLLPVNDSIPSYYRRLVESCLSERPQGRIAAKRMLRSFPIHAGMSPSTNRPSVEFAPQLEVSDHSNTTSHRSDKEYIDPELAVTIDEVRRRRDTGASNFTSGQVTYVDPESNPGSTDYRFESSGSWIIGNKRGRSPVSSRRRRCSPFGRTMSSSTSLSDPGSPPTGLPRAGSRDSSLNDEKSRNRVSFNPQSSVLANPSVMPPKLEALNQHDTVQHPPYFDGHFGDLQNQLLAARLLHTDSGFDEHMVEELEINEPQNQNDGCHKSAISVDGHTSRISAN